MAVHDFDHDFRMPRSAGSAVIVVESIVGCVKMWDKIRIEGLDQALVVSGIEMGEPPGLLVEKPGSDRLPIEPGTIVEGVEKE